MRIAIVDDTEADRLELLEQLARYAGKRKLHTRCKVFPSAELFLQNLTPGAFDLIFLDIYMDGMTGMEAARQLRALGEQSRLVFFTTSMTHAVESYTVRAAYYLTKPLDYFRFEQAMDAVCTGLFEEARTLSVSVKRVNVEVALQDILFADCSRERVQLHLADNTLVLDNRAGEILHSLLEDGRFLSCNRNVAVNMDEIVSVGEGDFLLKNGVCVPIRQRGRAAVKREFLTYSLRNLRGEERL